jgi:hypothetical protein
MSMTPLSPVLFSTSVTYLNTYWHYCKSRIVVCSHPPSWYYQAYTYSECVRIRIIERTDVINRRVWNIIFLFVYFDCKKWTNEISHEICFVALLKKPRQFSKFGRVLFQSSHTLTLISTLNAAISVKVRVRVWLNCSSTFGSIAEIQFSKFQLSIFRFTPCLKDN